MTEKSCPMWQDFVIATILFCTFVHGGTNFFVNSKCRIVIAIVMGASLVLGIIALVLGLGLRYWINRRKFYRRSPTGAEGFSSYEKSVIVKNAERLGKWLAYALIIFGVLFLWSYSRQKKAKEKASQNIEIQNPR